MTARENYVKDLFLSFTRGFAEELEAGMALDRMEELFAEFLQEDIEKYIASELMVEELLYATEE